MRVLGIDPGSRATGFGVIERRGSRLSHVAHGVIRLGGGPLETRLQRLFEALTEVVEAHRPEVVAVEGIFYARNARSALVLGHARGVALLVAALGDLEVQEYAPRVVKKALTSSGRAEKSQVQRMVTMLLRLGETPPSDAADALAVAMCHAQAAPGLQRVGTT